MKEHTKGPLEYGRANNYDGFYLAPKGILPTLAAVERCGSNISVTCFNFPGHTEANASHLVACWNACEHMEDPEVTVPELVEALKEIEKEVSGYHSEHDRNVSLLARAALDKAKP